MYPEDYSIRCTRLIIQWIVEGFVKEDEKSKTLEEIANEFLSELIRRSLVQVSSASVDGKAKVVMSMICYVSSSFQKLQS